MCRADNGRLSAAAFPPWMDTKPETVHTDCLESDFTGLVAMFLFSSIFIDLTATFVTLRWLAVSLARSLASRLMSRVVYV